MLALWEKHRKEFYYQLLFMFILPMMCCYRTDLSRTIKSIAIELKENTQHMIISFIFRPFQACFWDKRLNVLQYIDLNLSCLCLTQNVSCLMSLLLSVGLERNPFALAINTKHDIYSDLLQFSEVLFNKTRQKITKCTQKCNKASQDVRC